MLDQSPAGNPIKLILAGLPVSSRIKFLNRQNGSRAEALTLRAAFLNPTLGYPALGPVSWRRRSELDLHNQFGHYLVPFGGAGD